MLNWICPECGRECSPSRRECPGCAAAAEAARHSVLASGGISALARAVERDAGERGSQHSVAVAVAVLEEECGRRPGVGFAAETAGVAETAAGSICETVAAEVGLVGGMAVVAETVAVVDAVARVCVGADEATGIDMEVGLVEQPIAIDATVEVAQARLGLVAETAVIAETAAGSVCETVAAEIGLVEQPIAIDATGEVAPAEVEVAGETALVAEAAAADVADAPVCASADEATGIDMEVGSVEQPIAIDATVEVAQAQLGLVAETAVVAEATAMVDAVVPVCAGADEAAGTEAAAEAAEAVKEPIAQPVVGPICDTAAKAEVGLVEGPIASDATVEVAQAEVGFAGERAVVAEATASAVVEVAPESICETAANVKDAIADEAAAVAEEVTAPDVAEAAPESFCETAAIAGDADAEDPAAVAAVVRPTPALSDSSWLAFFEAQQVVAEDLLDVQAEQAAYSSAVAEVLASFHVAPAVMLLAPAGDMLTAPAPPLLRCAPSARPWIAAIPPKNPATRRNVAAHEPHLAGPSLPRQLQSFREAARSPAARGSKRTAIPAWVASVLAATVLFLAAGTLIQKLTADRDPKPRAAAAPATSQTFAADAHPLGRFVEVTGLRVVVDLKHRSQLQFVVVNHSATPISEMALRIAVRSTASSSNDALFRVAAVVPYLGPFQSKEVRTDLDAQLQSTQIPDWDYLKADVQVTAR